MALKEPGRFLTVARIVKPQGRRGEVAAEILTDFPERFAKLHRVYLEGSNGAAEAFELEAAWLHKGKIILKISGVNSIDDAERLRGNFVLIPHEEKTELPAGSYFVWELEGCRVMQTAGGIKEEIGTVTNVERTGGTDLLHVAGARTGRELLIPLAEAICRRIDTKAKEIWIDPPEDLLDLNA